MKIRIIASAVFAAIVIAVLFVIVVQKERLLACGNRVFFKLAPVDPRSLMQGDYMALRYALANDLSVIRWKQHLEDRSGLTIITLDKKHIAIKVRLYTNAEKLAPDEKLLHYKLSRGNISFGADSFFFQEGQGKSYEKAKYGELVLDDDGSSVLVGLRDEKLNILKAE